LGGQAILTFRIDQPPGCCRSSAWSTGSPSEGHCMRPANGERWEWPEAQRYVRDVCGNPPSYFAKVLAQTVPIERGKTRLLDIGSGSGIIGIYCLIEKGAAFVTFNDLQPAMIAITQTNVDRHISNAEIRSDQVDYLQAGFESISSAFIAKHDLLAFNPPQLPETLVSRDYLAGLLSRHSDLLFRIGARGSNPDGLGVIRDFVHWYAKLHTPRPEAIITVSSFLGIQQILRATEAPHVNGQIIKRTRVPLRMALVDAAIKLAANDFEKMDRSLEQSSDGSWTKEILTIRFCG
jgi:SAM-dependent methyltransferase